MQHLEIRVVEAAVHCQEFGAEGITIHPRPDERHIRRSDVFDIRPVIKTEFNIEGYPSREFLDLVIKAAPHQVTLVPDAPGQLTSNHGWDAKKNLSQLSDIIAELNSHNIRTSIFVGTDLDNLEAAKRTRTDRVELYTEPYATIFPTNREAALEPFLKAAVRANELDLGINAGHDLNLDNLKFFSDNIPNLLEVSIGHALIADALYFGLEKTIRLYKQQLMK